MKNPAEKGFPEPKIKKVKVEVCRTAGGKKFPFVVIDYSDVSIVSYSISMEGAEARETLELKVEGIQYTFQATNPFTSEPIEGETRSADSNDPEDQSDPNSSDSGTGMVEDDHESPGESGAAVAAAHSGVVAIGGLASGGSSGGNGSLSPLASLHDATARSNFPGLWDDNGFGLLPD